jgi:hypothetical protein
MRMGPATSKAWSRRTLAARSTYWRIDRLYHGTGLQVRSGHDGVPIRVAGDPEIEPSRRSRHSYAV